jgi:hypothetical protein
LAFKFVDDKLSARILNEARKQQVELENEIDCDANNNQKTDSDIRLEPNRKYARFSKVQTIRFSTKKNVDMSESESSESESEKFDDRAYTNQEIVCLWRNNFSPD